MKESFPDYDLNNRFGKLPGDVQKKIRRAFSLMKGGGVQRWHRIMHNKEVVDLRAHECLLFMEHTGCTFEEILDPSADLLEIYYERIHNKAKEEKANLYGLTKNVA
ncbi:MAG: hypothetical protein AAFN10_18185 [Bacteroidota bacterium]